MKYHTAQICTNGHLVVDSVTLFPEMITKYCPECGEKTLTKCLKCKAGIHGRVAGEFEELDMSPHPKSIKMPSFCHQCGAPHPWTTKRLEAIELLLDEDENLDAETKSKALEVLPDLLVDSPRTKLAAARWKKLLNGTTKLVGEMIKSIIVEIGTELPLKMLGMR